MDKIGITIETISDRILAVASKRKSVQKDGLQNKNLHVVGWDLDRILLAENDTADECDYVIRMWDFIGPSVVWSLIKIVGDHGERLCGATTKIFRGNEVCISK